nr:DUF4952 domain-containing protein [uncultured Psychroserpens sp.]
MKSIILLLSLLFLSFCANKSIECDDLLLKYAKKHQKIEFIECQKGTGQTVLQANYKVSGMHSEEIENILIKTYGIGKLKFTCCGWESTKGYIENEELKKINQNYILEVSMYGNAEMEDEKGKVYLERDRTKIEFYVIIKLQEI